MSAEHPVAQQVAENTILLAVARVSMALALPTVALISTIGGMWLSGRFENQELKLSAVQTETSSRVSAVETTTRQMESQVNTMGTKLTQLETKQTQESIANERFQRDVLVRLDRFQDSMGTMSTAITTLTTTLRVQGEADRRTRFNGQNQAR